MEHFKTPPKTYTSRFVGTVTNFDKLTDRERIDQYGVYPVVEPQDVKPWQTKSNPIEVYTQDACEITYTLAGIPLEMYQQQEIAKVYAAANRQLDQLVEGYSQLEVATWPAIQADVLAYGVSGVVGAAMQQAIDSSGYDADGLEDLLLPRIQQQATILASRKADAEAIMAALTHAEV